MDQMPSSGGTPPVGWQQPPKAEVPGAPGFVYADVPNRVIALIIDAIVLAFIAGILGAILGIVGLESGLLAGKFNALGTIVGAILGLVVAVAYFGYSWTVARATIGMRVLGMQVGNAFDGKTLTRDQAVRRALALWGPSMLVQFLNPVPGIGPILSLLALLWDIYLLYTTAVSPTKQGFHDVFANSVVVKSMRVA